MSYCRWSSMNWACDLYIYENVSGCWTIHVAGRRRVGKLPPDPLLSLPWPSAPEKDKANWMRRYRRHRKALDGVDMAPIALPYAGETFDLPTPGECADKVEELIALGFNCPDHVVPALREDQADLDAQGIVTAPADETQSGSVPEGDRARSRDSGMRPNASATSTAVNQGKNTP